MTRYVVFVALLLSVLAIQRRGLKSAFLDVWLPFFLLVPFAFRAEIPGLPDPNFMQAAILPILVVLLRERWSQMGFGRMEWLLAIYVLVRVVADFLGRGYADAQNYAFFMLSALIGPYLIGRYLITDRAMDIATARRFVLLFLVLFPMFVYELKFWVTPTYKLLSPLFPDVGSGLSLRYGMARTAGPFEHPILACIMVVAVYRLHRWLAWTGEWQQPQPGWMGWVQALSQRLPLDLQRQITIVLVVMALMTISRGRGSVRLPARPWRWWVGSGTGAPGWPSCWWG